MNRVQINVLWIGLAALVLVGLFPPWTQTFSANGIKSEKPIGYSLVLSPPAPEDEAVIYGVKIDVPRLATSLIALSALVGVGLVVTQGRGQKQKPPTQPKSAPTPPTVTRNTNARAQRQRANGDANWLTFRFLKKGDFRLNPWVCLMPVVAAVLLTIGPGSDATRVREVLALASTENSIEWAAIAYLFGEFLAIVAAVYATGVIGAYINWWLCGRKENALVQGSVLTVLIITVVSIAARQYDAASATTSPQFPPRPVATSLPEVPSPDVREQLEELPQPAPASRPTADPQHLQASAEMDAAHAARQQQLQDELLRRLLERERQAREQAAAPQPITLFLRRWQIQWHNNGRGTLTLHFANHGNRPVHLNTISTSPGRWQVIGHNVQPNRTLVHKVNIRDEPAYIDLETSLGQLRYDLIPDY